MVRRRSNDPPVPAKITAGTSALAFRPPAVTQKTLSLAARVFKRLNVVPPSVDSQTPARTAGFPPAAALNPVPATMRWPLGSALLRTNGAGVRANVSLARFPAPLLPAASFIASAVGAPTGVLVLS